MNADNARIARLSVTRIADIAQEVGPNAVATCTGTPASSSVLVLDTEAGSSVAENYTATCTRYGYRGGAVSPAMASGAPPDGAGAFAVAPWASGGATEDFTFHSTVRIPVPSRVAGHAFSYTVATVGGGPSRPLPGTRAEQSAGSNEVAP
jgi:hypothetical protein